MMLKDGRGETMKWHITVGGDQEAFQDFCESFMSENIYIERRWVQLSDKERIIEVMCIIDIDPYKPIDSTGSMPSFYDQITTRFNSVSVIKF